MHHNICLYILLQYTARKWTVRKQGKDNNANGYNVDKREKKVP